MGWGGVAEPGWAYTWERPYDWKIFFNVCICLMDMGYLYLFFELIAKWSRISEWRAGSEERLGTLLPPSP